MREDNSNSFVSNLGYKELVCEELMTKNWLNISHISLIKLVSFLVKYLQMFYPYCVKPSYIMFSISVYTDQPASEWILLF